MLMSVTVSSSFVAVSKGERTLLERMARDKSRPLLTIYVSGLEKSFPKVH